MQAVLCKTCEKEPIAGHCGEKVMISWGILAFFVSVYSHDTCASCAADERLKEIKAHFNHDNEWFRPSGHDLIRGERPSKWIITAKQRGTATDYTIHWEGYFDASTERRQRIACYMEELGILSREASGNWQVLDDRRGIVLNLRSYMSTFYFTRRWDANDFVYAYNESSYGNSAYVQQLR